MATRYGGRDDFRGYAREDEEDRYGRDYETGGRNYGRGNTGESSRRYTSGRDYDDYDTGRGYGSYGSRSSSYGGYDRGHERGEIGGNIGGYGRDRSRGYGSTYYGGSTGRGYEREEDYSGRGSDYDRTFGSYGGRRLESDRRSTTGGRNFGGYLYSSERERGGRGDYDDDRYNFGGGFTSRDEGRDYYGRGNYGRGPAERGYGGHDYDRGYTGREYDREHDRGEYRSRDRDRDRDEDRGWFDRATDEVRSWFGDDEAERRRRMDEMQNSGRSDYFGARHRGRGPKNYRRSDERVREDVSDRLSDNDWLDASDIEVQVENGNVTLTGTVESRYAKRLAEDIAESCSGVTNVQNNLRVAGRNTEGSGTEMTTSTSGFGLTGSTGAAGMTDATSTTGTTGMTGAADTGGTTDASGTSGTATRSARSSS
jgi:osmotically-inducible protein OsmY